MRRLFLFYAAGVRFERGSRGEVARRSRLRALPSKVLSPRLRTAPIRSPALLAYLRWVTKNSNDRTWTVVAIFLCPQEHRDSNGVRAAKPLARTALKSVVTSSPHRPYPKPCTTRISPVGHQNKHGLHEEAVFVLRRRREIRTGFARRRRGSRGEAACAHRPQKCSRFVSAPPLSEVLHYSHSSGGSACAPAVIDLPAIDAGDADPAAARPGMPPPRANAFPTTPARRTTLVKVRL